jgi:hypothetical protein
MKSLRQQGVEVECPACEGSGFAKVQQPTQPDRKNFRRAASSVWARGELNRRVIEEAGVEFIPASKNGEGVGVRLK